MSLFPGGEWFGGMLPKTVGPRIQKYISRIEGILACRLKFRDKELSYSPKKFI